jgi:eukaryotic-like serine/threonine-protein kinase
VFEKELGRGGMATVYLAQDLRHKRRVALKVLHPDLSHSLGADRFLREIETAAGLTHPHILPLHDSGEAAGFLYYVMPYVEGESLRDRLLRETQLPIDDALRIAREVADALAYAHRQGIVHRDIKPENILLSGGHALVADFGIARALGQFGGERLTQTGMAVGTPAYMSPEQASGSQVDGRTDVYALGCVLYEMLAGEPPYTGPTAQAITVKRLTDPVPAVRRLRPMVPATVERTVLSALAPVPADRWAGAHEFAEALADGGAPQQSGGVRSSGRMLTLGFAGLVVVLLVGALILLRRPALRPEAGGRVEPGASRGTQALPDPTRFTRSVAVLPLVNVGAEPDQEYFADGMTDELISALGKVPGLRVAARSSAFAFKGREADLQEVSAKLHVATVLEGSVRRAGSSLRLTAQLVNTADGLALWSDTYERQLKDVFQVQEEIASAIAGALRLALGGDSATSSTHRGAGSVEAHDLYLRGRFFLNRGGEANLRHSLALFEQAAAKDSTYAPPWAGIAAAWSWLADDYLPPREANPRAKAAARHAIALDSTLAEAHALLGLVLQFYDWDHQASGVELRRAIALDPNDATAHWVFGLALLTRPDQLDAGLAALRRAQALDPLSDQVGAGAGIALELQRRYDEAVAQFGQALELNPESSYDLWAMSEALLLAGNPAKAFVVLRRAHEPSARIEASMARALVGLGRRPEAMEILRAMERNSRRQHYALPIASVYVALGNPDGTFRWLTEAYEARAANMAFLATDPLWDPVRSDPRFGALMKKVGF